MRPSERDGFLDALCLLLGTVMLVAAVALMLSCSPEEQNLSVAAIKTAETRCRGLAFDVIASSTTCPQAQAGLDSLARLDPACLTVLRGENFRDFCKDGGP